MTSNYLTASIGMALFILGMVRMINGIAIPTQFIISFSIAAMWFTLLDFYNFFLGSRSSRYEKKIRKTYNLGNESSDLGRLRNVMNLRSKFIPLMLTYLASLSIIVLPQLPIFKIVSKDILDRISDGTLLLSLGLVVVMYGVKGVAEMRNRLDTAVTLAIEIYKSNNSDSQDNIKSDAEVGTTKENVESESPH